MTLVVGELERDLHRSVLAALQEISPGSAFELLADGTVVRDGSSSCDAYCRHRAGCNLVDQLMDGEGKVTIFLTGFGSTYKQDPGSDPVSGRIYWDPTETSLTRDWCGGVRTRPSVVLAHELVHALQDQLGILQKTDPGEFQAIRGENQIRGEMCEPPRVKYGSTPVLDWEGTFIDGSDCRGCGCETRMGGSHGDSLRCAMRKALLCALERLEERPDVEFVAHDGAARLLGHVSEADAVLAARIRTAEETRAGSPHAALVHRLTQESLARDPFTVCLEAVALSSSYGALLAHPVEGGLRIVTNLVFGLGETYFVGGPAELVEHTLSASPAFRSGLDGIAFSDGIGGLDTAVDGAAQFLTVKRPDGRILTTALYGYEYPAFDASWVQPEDMNASRWEGVNQVFGLTRGALANGPGRTRMHLLSER